ncbi:MAG: hypothetical protein QM755_06680 [Luteolibacter sp.]
MLAARMSQFGGDARFLSALGQAALAGGKTADAVTPVLKLVRMAKQPAGEFGESVGLAARVIRASGKIDEWREDAHQTKSPLGAGDLPAGGSA